MNYNDPDMTVRQGVEASLTTVSARIASLDPIITAVEADVAVPPFDTGSTQVLANTLSSLRGTRLNLQAEADRLQAIIDAWDAEAE